MAETKSVLELDYKTIVNDNDSVVASVNNIVSRIKISTLKGMMEQWDYISNKPSNNNLDIYAKLFHLQLYKRNC